MTMGRRVNDQLGRSLLRQPRRRLLVAVLCAGLLLAAVAYLGARSPWGTKHPHVTQGVAMRANSNNDLVMFDGEDDTQLQFGGDHVHWSSGSEEGEGNPPCLKTPLKKMEVEVGSMWIEGPGGGSSQQAVWVRCP